MMTRIFSFATVALFAAAAAPAAPIAGTWTNPSHGMTIRIAPCGPALCGRVVAASAKARADAVAGSGQPLIGSEVLSAVQPDGPDQWRGRLWLPDIDQHADVTLTPAGANALAVQGCLGGLICKTQTWVRASPRGAGRRR